MNEQTTQQQLDAVQRWLDHPSNESVFVAGDPWTDDHVLCFTLSVCGVEVEWLMAGEDAYAAAKYANESATARADLVDRLLADLGPRLHDQLLDEHDQLADEYDD